MVEALAPSGHQCLMSEREAMSGRLRTQNL